MDSPDAPGLEKVRDPSYRVGLVVLCEAEGVDQSDAQAVAQLALQRLIHEHKLEGAAGDVASSTDPACAFCGARPGVHADGTVAAHATGELWIVDADDTERLCEGSRQQPHVSRAPVIGHDLADGHKLRARVLSVMDVGMAAGNGYLWLTPTAKAYR